MTFSYWLVRYVPDVVRGEFVNVGVLVASADDAQWAFRRVDSLARANRLGGNSQSIEPWLTRLSQAVSNRNDGLFYAEARGAERITLSSGWVERMRIRHNNAVQISQARPVNARNIDEAADLLVATLLAEPQTRKQSTAKTAAIRSLRDAYFEHLPAKAIRPNVEIEWGRQKAKFEFAIGRFKIAQLSSVWSFQRKDPDAVHDQIRSWCWGVHKLRDQGGMVISPKRVNPTPMHVDRSIPVRVLYVPPKNALQREVFESAQEMWHDLEIKAFAQEQEDALVADAAELTGSISP